MKKVLFLVLLSVGLMAQTSIKLTYIEQSSEITPNSSIYLSTKIGLTTKINVDYMNTSNSSKDYMVKRYDILLNQAGTSTAVAYFCFGGSCYGSSMVESPAPVTLKGGESASQKESQIQYEILTAELDEADSKGYSLVKYTFYNASLHSDSVQFSIRYNDPAAGIATVAGPGSFRTYPSPVKDALVIDLAGKTGALEIVDMTGRLLYSKQIEPANSDEIRINTSQFISGLYFVRLTNASEVISRKFVVDSKVR
jgi:hypothetical protein